jgi:hypothetical protein
MPRRWFIEVDQSGRMEMSGDTVVAVANGFSVTVRITPDVKDIVRETLRRRGVRPRLIMIRMFVAAITLALQDHLAEIGGIVIDEEYIGYEAELKSLLLDRLRKLGCQREATDVTISRVGKKSPAHFAAICVTRRQAKADITPTPEALLELC